MKKKAYVIPNGMPVAALPRGRRNRENARRRKVMDLGTTSAARLISESGLFLDESYVAPTAILADQGTVLSFLIEILKMTSKPFAAIGMARELDGVPVSTLGPAEEIYSLDDYKAGNVIIKLAPQPGLHLMLEQNMQSWSDHLMIMIPGSGMTMTRSLLETMESCEFIVIAENLSRALNGITGEEFLGRMDYVLCSEASAGALAALSLVLPTYEAEVNTNTMDLSLHRDQPYEGTGFEHRNGGGLRIGQSRSLKEQPLLSRSDLQHTMGCGKLVAYNARRGMVVVAEITH